MPKVEIDGVLYVPITEIGGIDVIAKAILRATHFAGDVDEPGFDYKDHLKMTVDIDYGAGGEHAATFAEVLEAIVEEQSA